MFYEYYFGGGLAVIWHCHIVLMLVNELYVIFA